MKFIFFVILKGNIVVILSYLISFIIEKISGLALLWWNLRQKQNYNMARAASDIAAIFYFVINYIILYKELRLYPIDPEGYSFILWLIIIIPLTIGFRKLHLKLKPIDPNKDDFDISG
ncbi:hypothetical protein ACX8XN_08550 [Calditrichota bacterium GD2]